MNLNETHDPARRSWVESANDATGDFPIQNLPLGIFSNAQNRTLRPGIAIGNQILDLSVAHQLNLIPASFPRELFEIGTLDRLLGLGVEGLSLLRGSVGRLLDTRASPTTIAAARNALVGRQTASMYRPTSVQNYTDFYAGIFHAKAAGALLTPENPLPRNYKWVPIGYHGRASSVVASGSEVYRPSGQLPPKTEHEDPRFGPSERLDLELELGFFLFGENKRGQPVSISEARERIAGFCLLNDWSARDIQRWEMFPLGPFLSKSFATTVSPWLVSPEALLPFAAPALKRDVGDPKPMAYLYDANDQASGGIDIALQVLLSTERMRSERMAPERVIKSNARYLYWTPAQMVAHHTVNGCNLMNGDLIGTGTISGPADDELGSMLELTYGGKRPVTLSNGEVRSFLLDGDEITLTGRCERAGFASIGFGQCVGRIRASPAWNPRSDRTHAGATVVQV